MLIYLFILLFKMLLILADISAGVLNEKLLVFGDHIGSRKPPPARCLVGI